jgi:hypothetical protein
LELAWSPNRAITTARFSPATQSQGMVSRLSEKTQAYLIDALTNSTDLYDEDQFVEWLTTQTDLSPDALDKIYRSYWLLDPLEHDSYKVDDWRRWLEQTIDFLFYNDVDLSG